MAAGVPGISMQYRVPRSPGAGGSRPFLVVASDEQQYWVKAPNNPQGPMVPVNEQIVGRLGRLIGIAVCDVTLIEIPADLAGTEIEPGYVLAECIAHASRNVDGALEVRGSLEHRTDDDNARRQAGMVVLHDWLWGEDDQWIRAATNENRYFSHDHGHYFPNGPNWTVPGLQEKKDEPHPSPCATAGLDPGEMGRLADALDALTQGEIAANVEHLPADWPVGAAEIAAVVDFSLARAPRVAERAREVAATL